MQPRDAWRIVVRKEPGCMVLRRWRQGSAAQRLDGTAANTRSSRAHKPPNPKGSVGQPGLEASDAGDDESEVGKHLTTWLGRQYQGSWRGWIQRAPQHFVELVLVFQPWFAASIRTEWASHADLGQSCGTAMACWDGPFNK